MKKGLLSLFFILMLVSLACADELLYEEDLVYEGAFRLPQGQYGATAGSTYAYGGNIAYNPSSHSLFMVGHTWEQLVGEVAIPRIRNSSNLADLATGLVLQNFTDIAEGRKALVGSEGVGVFGLMVYDDKLYATLNIYYDASSTQNVSHIMSNKDLSITGDVLGPVKVGTGGPGYVAGWLVDVPEDWEDRLGQALTGACCIPIVGRTSAGPGAAYSFDPINIGSVNPVPAVPLQYYTLANNIGEWSGNSLLYNSATEIVGAVFPEDTDTIIYFGKHGIGENCYGIGTGNQSLHNTSAEGPVIYCYDPAESAKGTHAYPYVYQAWAYDANDFLKVKNGEMQPWNVTPYAVWNFELPFQNPSRRISGVAYDPENNRILLAQRSGEGFGMPIIHSFIINFTEPEESEVEEPEEQSPSIVSGSGSSGGSGGGSGIIPQQVKSDISSIKVARMPPFVLRLNQGLVVSDGVHEISFNEGKVYVRRIEKVSNLKDALLQLISFLQ